MTNHRNNQTGHSLYAIAHWPTPIINAFFMFDSVPTKLEASVKFRLGLHGFTARPSCLENHRDTDLLKKLEESYENIYAYGGSVRSERGFN